MLRLRNRPARSTEYILRLGTQRRAFHSNRRLLLYSNYTDQGASPRDEDATDRPSTSTEEGQLGEDKTTGSARAPKPDRLFGNETVTLAEYLKRSRAEKWGSSWHENDRRQAAPLEGRAAHVDATAAETVAAEKAEILESRASIESLLANTAEQTIKDRRTGDVKKNDTGRPAVRKTKSSVITQRRKRTRTKPTPTRTSVKTKKSGLGGDMDSEQQGNFGKAKSSAGPVDIRTLHAKDLELRAIEDDTPLTVPELTHNLDRVLFNPGVYHIQDQRTGVFNFDPYLTSIMPVKEFDYSALKEYITSSKHAKLRQLCAEHNLKYCGSTSSMTSMLSHFHFLLSAWRKPNYENLSRSLQPEHENFTQLTRAPAAAFARFQDGVYAIDADKEYDAENVLTRLGKSMEKLLTLPKEAFEKYRRTKSHEIPDEEKNAEEAYHFTTMGDFMLRSQLDAYDKRLPGTGMFDLKTRAVVSIRMDVAGYEKGVGYEIRERFGNWESFEREYFDMIRAAFLKYSLQVRMGRMDGIFVAFHNTQRIFGFQYISLEEMDQALHETTDLRLGDQEFKFSIALLNDLMDRATKRFPGRTLRIHVETRPTKVPLTYFFAEPVTDEEMTRIQTLGRPSPEELEREIRSSLEQEEGNLPQEEENTQLEQQQPEERDASETVTSDSGTEATWAELIAKVDETVENDSRGIDLLRDAVQEAIEQYSVSRGLPQLMNEEYRDALVEALTAHLMKSQTSREAADRGEEDDNYQAGDPEPDSTQDRPQTEATPLSNLVMEATKGLDDGSQGLAAFQRMLTELTPQSKAGSVQTEEDAPDEDAVAKEVPVNSVSAESESTKEDTEPATDEEVSARVNGEDGDDASKVDIPDDAETADAAVAPDSAAKEDEAETASPQEDAEGEVLGMYVTIRNRVNDRYVERPRVKGERFDWSVEYAVETLPDKQTHKIYSEIKRRRKKLLVQDPEGKERQWHHMFSGNLPRFSKKGEEYREMRTQLEADGPIYVAWDKEPLSPEAISDAEQGRS